MALVRLVADHFIRENHPEVASGVFLVWDKNSHFLVEHVAERIGKFCGQNVQITTHV